VSYYSNTKSPGWVTCPNGDRFSDTADHTLCVLEMNKLLRQREEAVRLLREARGQIETEGGGDELLARIDTFLTTHDKEQGVPVPPQKEPSDG